MRSYARPVGERRKAAVSHDAGSAASWRDPTPPNHNGVTTERRPPCTRIVDRARAIAPPRAIPASLLVNRTTSLVPRVPTHARAALVAPCLDAFAVTGLAVVVVVLVVVAIIPIDRSKK